MVHQKTLTSLILGAGLAAARPAPWFAQECKQDHSQGALSFSAFSGSPASSIFPVATGSTFGTDVSGGGAPIQTGTTGSIQNVKKSSRKSLSIKKSSSSTAKASSSVSAASSAAPSTVSSSSNDTSPAVAAVPSSPSIVTATADAGCTFTDADTAIASKASCSNIVLSGITVAAGVTLDMTGLNDGTTVTFEGTTTFEYSEWEGPLISFDGTDIEIIGASGHVIDGNGAAWWDGKGSNGGVTKPKFFYAHKLIDSTISGLNIRNYPVQCFSVNGASNLYIKDVTIDNSAGDALDSSGDALGHNTDAFDVGSSTGVYISGANVKNQDDCLAINSGTDISFTGGTCSGGHGLSIGSVGGRDDNDVANIYIADNTISDSDNGVRIKTVYDATGSVKNVTYSGITLSNIASYGIVIEQDYENGSPTGTPTSGVPITDLTIENVTGSIASGAEEVYILCASCSSWTWTGVSITGGDVSSSCTGVPSGASC